MKRVLFFMLMIGLVLAFAGCGNGEAGQGKTGEPPTANSGETVGQTYKAKIMQIDGEAVLLAAQEDQAGAPVLCSLPLNGIKLTDQQGKGVGAAVLAAGMTVDVSYDGTVLETYPAQLANVSGVKITGQGEDMVGFYRGVLQDLYDKDPALNDNISMLAFDLTAAQNLTGAEKEALIWLAREQF